MIIKGSGRRWEAMGGRRTGCTVATSVSEKNWDARLFAVRGGKGEDRC